MLVDKRLIAAVKIYRDAVEKSHKKGIDIYCVFGGQTDKECLY